MGLLTYTIHLNFQARLRHARENRRTGSEHHKILVSVFACFGIYLVANSMR